MPKEEATASEILWKERRYAFGEESEQNLAVILTAHRLWRANFKISEKLGRAHIYSESEVLALLDGLQDLSFEGCWNWEFFLCSRVNLCFCVTIRRNLFFLFKAHSSIESLSSLEAVASQPSIESFITLNAVAIL